MNIKMICLGAIALSMSSAAALAGSESGSSALDNSAMMEPFYTDSSMKTMRSDEEFKAAWMKMSPDDQAAMTKACNDASMDTNAQPKHPEFCSSLKKNGGGNTNN